MNASICIRCSCVAICAFCPSTSFHAISTFLTSCIPPGRKIHSDTTKPAAGPWNNSAIYQPCPLSEASCLKADGARRINHAAAEPPRLYCLTSQGLPAMRAAQGIIRGSRSQEFELSGLRFSGSPRTCAAGLGLHDSQAGVDYPGTLVPEGLIGLSHVVEGFWITACACTGSSYTHGCTRNQRSAFVRMH